ncbi:MAG: AAA family ATPase [Gammaproteobacteria bacterium]|nr:AAA family ATPase [Gammaproteobacteria bacterium]
MYYEYFGLKQPPFRITPDTTLFFPGGNRGPILEALVYAILNGEGIVKVVGEVGSGKTMLCRMLEKELPGHVEIVYLANPSLSPENILHAIAFELKLPVQPVTSRLQVMQDLQNYLLERHAGNRQVLVFVEEAQGMPIATLEQIRLLSNLETQQHKLLQLVLFGQPELDVRMARPEIRQLKERITYSFHLNPFAVDDIRDYLNSRLRACGFRGAEVFTPAAVRAIARHSNGLVRRINILADKSLLAAYADNMHEVSARHVRRAASDSEFASGRHYVFPTLIGALVLTLAVGILWWINRTPPKEPVAALTPTPSASVEARPAPGAVVTERAAEEPATIPSPVPDAAVAANPESPVLQHGSASERSEAFQPQDTPVLPAPETAVTEQASPAGEVQLLGMNAVFRVQDFGDSRLSPEESDLLQKQLAAVPPEEAIPEGLSPTGDVCRLCWSIIYRPLKSPENL